MPAARFKTETNPQAQLKTIGRQGSSTVMKRWGLPETICFIWVGLALVVIFPATTFLQGAFPIFTAVWLVVPMLSLLRGRDASRIGFQRISWSAFLRTTAINLGAIILIAILVEPWSHAYRALVQAALTSPTPDTTFAWLASFDGWLGWAGLLVYSGLVTIFAEELFFRGLLLQFLLHRMSKGWAVLIQATLFTLPQLLAGLLLPPLQGVIYAGLYSWLAIGVVGGWAAVHTQTIWPSLVSATLWNAILIAWIS